jgi:multiple antibiotic resistance protein
MTFYTAAMTLILVMDPLGNIPAFLAILRRFSVRTQLKIITRETLIAFVVLTLFLFFGHYILRGFQITTAAISISGGIILFLIAIRMIFPPEKNGDQELPVEEPFVVPLAIPFTAGPSAIATVLLFATQNPARMTTWFLSLVAATAAFLAIMLSARYLMRLLGTRGLVAMERLMGMILTTLAVQMFLSGIEQYLILNRLGS